MSVLLERLLVLATPVLFAATKKKTAKKKVTPKKKVSRKSTKRTKRPKTSPALGDPIFD